MFASLAVNISKTCKNVMQSTIWTLTSHNFIDNNCKIDIVCFNLRGSWSVNHFVQLMPANIGIFTVTVLDISVQW